MKSKFSIRLSAKKGLLLFMLGMSMLSIVRSQTITINKQLFVAGTYPDSANITVPIDLNTQGTFGFGYNAVTNSFDSNYFKLALIPVANANAVITDTSDAAINSLGGNVIGKYTFSNKQVPYTAFVNGMIPKVANGTVNTANYVLKVISTNPFVVSDATDPIVYQKRANTLRLKSFAIIGSKGAAFNYESTHSAVFFGYCGAVIDSKGNPADTTITIVDSTTGTITVGNGYDSVILIKNEFSSLINTDTVVFRDVIAVKGSYSFPTGIIKAGNFYTLLMKSKDDNGYNSTKSYFVLNSLWNLNLAKKSSPNGCKGDTITLYPELNNIQASQQFGITDNFPGFLYNVNWGDPKSKLAQNFSYSQWMNNLGIVTHLYDTSSCLSPLHYWTITAKLSNPFQGSSCSYPIATPTVQIWSSVKAKIVRHDPVCISSSLDTATVIIKDSSYGGTNASCTGNAYYVWYKAFVGCGTINDTVFTPVDSSVTTLSNGNIVPSYVPHYDYRDKFTQAGKWMIKLVANNNTCTTNGYIDSLVVENSPKAKFKFQGASPDSVLGCSPLNVAVNNLSDSTCTQKWSFNWDVTDTFGIVQNLGTDYNFLVGFTSSDSAPKVVFNKQGVYYLRLIASNACTKSDTVLHKVNVNGNGGVSFPNGNKSSHTAGWRGNTNAYCTYTASKQLASILLLLYQLQMQF